MKTSELIKRLQHFLSEGDDEVDVVAYIGEDKDFVKRAAHYTDIELITSFIHKPDSSEISGTRTTIVCRL